MGEKVEQKKKCLDRSIQDTLVEIDWSIKM